MQACLRMGNSGSKGGLVTFWQLVSLCVSVLKGRCECEGELFHCFVNVAGCVYVSAALSTFTFYHHS